MLDTWLGWAARSRIDTFVELGRRIRKNLAGIKAALVHNLPNALVESTNAKIRLPPTDVRIPLPRSPRRPRPSRPRRLLPTTPGQTMTAALRRPNGRLRLPYRPSGRCAPSGLVSNKRRMDPRISQ